MKTRVIQNEPGEPRPGHGEPRAERVTSERGGSITALIRRYPLPAFFALAFALTWATTPFGVFMAAGPLLAAIVVTSAVDGRRGLRELASRILRWRVNWRWYAAAIFIPLAAVMASGGLNVLFGAVESPVRDLGISGLVLMFALRLVVPIFSPVGEEPGWRGFALPRLLADRSPFGATLILAPIIAVWHVPLIFIASEDLPPLFLLATVAVTFFYTWLFVHSGGSVLITIIAHASEGLIVRELIGTDGWSGADETQYALIYTGAWCVVAIALLIFDRQMWRSSNSGRQTARWSPSERGQSSGLPSESP